jgi:hypothetical protein
LKTPDLLALSVALVPDLTHLKLRLGLECVKLLLLEFKAMAELVATELMVLGITHRPAKLASGDLKLTEQILDSCLHFDVEEGQLLKLVVLGRELCLEFLDAGLEVDSKLLHLVFEKQLLLSGGLYR